MLDSKEELTKKESKEKLDSHEYWSNPLEFLISTLGYAVGLGNVWRFPFLCYKHGGGSFLIAYVFMLLSTGLPILFLEMALGQYAGVGPIQAFHRLAPLLRGFGFALIYLTILITYFYTVVVAWALLYTLDTFTLSDIRWSTCDNWFNSKDCISSKDNILIDHRNMSSVIQYWEKYILGNPFEHDWNHMGTPDIKLVISLGLAWSLIALSLIRGVKSSGKVVYFTTFFPYIILIALGIRSVTLPGSWIGLQYYITPKWDHFMSFEIWIDAATQIVFSLGTGSGSVITLSSYNKKSRNTQFDAIVVGICNGIASVLSGFVVFGILGHMSYISGLHIDEVAVAGPGLAFIVYPEVVTQLPLSQLWAFLFFAMLLMLALGTLIASLTTIIKSVTDHWPQFREKEYLIIFTFAFIQWLAGLIFTTGGGLHVFILFNTSVPSWNLLIIVLVEICLIGWIYGTSNFIKNLNEDLNMKISKIMESYWNFTWKFLTPIILIILIFFSWYSFGSLRYQDYVYPFAVQVASVFITVSVILIILAFAIYEYWKNREEDAQSMLKPTSQWWREPSYGSCT